MIRKQKVCTGIVALALLLAAGTIETTPAAALIMLMIMGAAIVAGGLDKKRVTVEDIERRCRDAANR